MPEPELQGPTTASITIGELAQRTGLTPAALRMWESRHGFPQPRRLTSGHRRYDSATVDRVRAVLRLQSAGVRLETAIAEAGSGLSATSSVYAELRRRHPELTPHVLRKSTLLALSRAIEDEGVARADRGVLFGAFQHARHLRASRARWEDLARTARIAIVFTADGGELPTGSRLAHVALAADTPMRREWSIVSDDTPRPVVLSAWELPGQGEVADADRRFESIWTLDPTAVRAAARVCAGLAARAGLDIAATVADGLAAPATVAADLADAERLFSRVVAYLEAGA